MRQKTLFVISRVILTAGCGVAAATGSGVVGAAEAAGATASVSISKKSAPTSTVSPSAEKYCLMTPDSGDVISTVTLSVSILAIISSARTKSPGPICIKSKLNMIIELTFDEFFNDSFGD